MQIVIAGGHGQIAMLLHPLLKARGHRVRGLGTRSAGSVLSRSIG